MTIDSSTGHISWTPDYDDTLAGSIAVTVTVDDGDGDSDAQTWTVQIGYEDADEDGMADEWETANGLDPADASDADADADGDGLSNLDEFLDGTDPNSFDGPSTPVLVSPIEDDEVGSSSPWLVLENSEDPQLDVLTYDFEVYLDEAMTVLFTEGSGIEEGASDETEWKVDSALSENSSVWWRARASDANGSSPWSDLGLFFVNEFNEAPSTPVAVYPTDGQTVASALVSLEWALSSDVDRDGLTYSVELSNEAGDEVIASVEELSFEEGSVNGSWEVDVVLEEDRIYVWTAQAVDEHGLGSDWSDGEAFFYSLGNEAPTGIVFVSPEDGSSVDTASPTLVVQEGVDPEGGALSYRIEVDGVETFDSEHLATTTIAGSGSGTVEWDLGVDGIELADDSWSYARAVGIDDAGIESAPATIHFFVTLAADAPPVPTLLSPEDGSETAELMPTLVAEPVEDPEGDAVFYDFVVASDVELSEVLAGGEGLSILAGSGPEGFEEMVAWTVDQTLIGEVFWSARAVDETGAASDWAPAFRLVVSTGEPTLDEILDEVLGGGAGGDFSDCNCSSSVAGEPALVSRLALVAALFFLPLAAWRRRICGSCEVQPENAARRLLRR